MRKDTKMLHDHQLTSHCHDLDVMELGGVLAAESLVGLKRNHANHSQKG
jgi:hypothetical protein